MGIPLFKMSCEQTGGKFTIESEKGVGTKINALYKTDSIDFTPLGDIAATIVTIVSMNADKEFLYRRVLDDKEFIFPGSSFTIDFDDIKATKVVLCFDTTDGAQINEIKVLGK